MRFAPSKSLTAMVSLTALSLMLAGCGGGGGVNSTPAPPTPAPTPTPTPAPTPMPTPTPTPTPTPPATKIVGKPAVSTTFAATANLAAVDYDVGRAQSASGGPVADASLVYDTGTTSFTPRKNGREERREKGGPC